MLDLALDASKGVLEVLPFSLYFSDPEVESLLTPSLLVKLIDFSIKHYVKDANSETQRLLL